MLYFRIGVMISIFLTGCVSPKNWSSDRHFEAMSMCQYMCDENGVKRYTPMLGTCECNKGK